MEFRILGPLEVVSDDGPVRVPRAKTRELLALLLVHANRVVARDRLAEALWEGSPPPGATATLQSYAYRLRKALPVDALRTRGGGYVLEVKDSAVDALRFERVVKEVSHVEDASPRWVSVRLGEALAWWRGRPLSDFEGAAWALPEAARLEDLRLNAIEDLFEARLALAEHAALVPELESLVSQHPLRERPWGQLILALYRSDRQADALRAHHRVRTMLAAELGLEPGPELLELERRILDHDETLVVQPPVTAGSATVAPTREEVAASAEPGVGLPNTPTSFVGRGTQVDEVSRLLGRHRIVTLTGPGGGGKTRLAIEIAGRVADRLVDGVHFADLAAVTNEGHVGDAVATALGLTQDPFGADPLRRIATYLEERSMLCVLDNCEHVLDASAKLSQAIVSRPGSSCLLATSREPLGVVGEQVYAVPSLEVETEAVGLFGDRAAQARAGFVIDDANRAAVADICRRLDGIPLAIELAAARIAHLSPAQLLERLDDRFALLTGERRVPRHQTLAATLDWSYEALDDREQEVLRCLAVFPASFGLEAAEAVGGGADVVEALGSLVAKSLVQVVDDGERLRYRLLETVRLYAEDRVVESEAHSCRVRHRDWLVDWLESLPDEHMFDDLNRFKTEYPNIRAGLEWSQAHGNAEAVARIAARVDWYRDEHWHDGTRWCEAAVAADAVPRDLRVQLYVILSRLGIPMARGLTDWAGVAAAAQQAIDAAEGTPSPFHADALGVRAIPAAVEAIEHGDESLAQRATDLAEACVTMGEQFSAP